MKKVILIGIMSLTMNLFIQAQTTDVIKITDTITAFAKAGDINDAKTLETLLDDNYRIVMNRLFGSNEVIVMTKDVYIGKIKSKEYGGDTRVLDFENIVINGSTANVKVTYKGTTMIFCNLVTLLKNSEGNWKLVAEVPILI